VVNINHSFYRLRPGTRTASGTPVFAGHFSPGMLVAGQLLTCRKHHDSDRHAIHKHTSRTRSDTRETIAVQARIHRLVAAAGVIADLESHRTAVPLFRTIRGDPALQRPGGPGATRQRGRGTHRRHIREAGALAAEPGDTSEANCRKITGRVMMAGNPGSRTPRAAAGTAADA